MLGLVLEGMAMMRCLSLSQERWVYIHVHVYLVKHEREKYIVPGHFRAFLIVDPNPAYPQHRACTMHIFQSVSIPIERIETIHAHFLTET